MYEAYPALFTGMVGFGMMRGLRVKDADSLAALINNAREEGLLMLANGRNTLRFLPPLTITKGEIDEGFKRLDNAIASL